MKSIINNINKLLPYFIVVAAYFFFINIEARKVQKTNNSNYQIEESLPKNSNIKETKIKISIPVIPYGQ